MLRKFLHRLETFSLPSLSRRALVLLWLAGIVLFVALLAWLLRDKLIAVLMPRGVIAQQQRDLLYFATGLSLLVLVPTYYMLYTFAWKYREGHSKQYLPKWDTNKKLEAVWWGIPIAIIAVLAVVTWTTSHSLDPYKPLVSSKKPLQVQVVALQWKWLFIYPDHEVASVNKLVIPIDRPVEFTITSDAPMNSFWIPQLAGQIYAMSGMSTKLHVNATSVGEYRGMSSNLSGARFADMTFMADARTESNFAAWVNKTASDKTLQVLNQRAYDKLARPASSGVLLYRQPDKALYENVIMKYMTSEDHAATTHDLPASEAM
jgi:cytochrome o ubiquinol oxidase subunit II